MKRYDPNWDLTQMYPIIDGDFVRHEDVKLLVSVLLQARDSLMWWEEEHSCCAGASDKALNAIDAAIADITGTDSQPS